jgi:hypothetical protein
MKLLVLEDTRLRLGQRACRWPDLLWSAHCTATEKGPSNLPVMNSHDGEERAGVHSQTPSKQTLFPSHALDRVAQFYTSTFRPADRTAGFLPAMPGLCASGAFRSSSAIHETLGLGCSAPRGRPFQKPLLCLLHRDGGATGGSRWWQAFAMAGVLLHTASVLSYCHYPFKTAIQIIFQVNI